MPLVSVVIPTYNRSDILKNTLESVFSESFSDFEIIVVDDGSTESINHLVQQYEDKVTFIQLPHSGLPSVARNCGIKNAKGRYIAFLDSDDLWLTDKLKTQLQVFSDKPEIVLICSDAYILKPDTFGELNTLYLKDRQGKTGFLLEDLINNNFIITSTCIVHHDVLDRIGGFSENPQFRGIEDYELWLRIAWQYQIHYIPEPLAVYQDVGINLRSEFSRISYYDGIDRIYTTLQSLIPEKDRHTAFYNLLAKKIYDNNVQKMYLFLDIEDWVHFKFLFRDLIVVNPFLFLKICVRIVKKFIRKLRAHIIKKENILNKVNNV